MSEELSIFRVTNTNLKIFVITLKLDGSRCFVKNLQETPKHMMYFTYVNNAGKFTGMDHIGDI